MNIKISRGGATITMFLAFTIALIVMNYTINVEDNTIKVMQRSWTALADADPGAGAGGYLRIGTCAHQATPDTAYESNVTGGIGWYEYTDSLGSAEMTGETPSDTAFDFVMVFRTNVSHNWASNNNSWVIAWVRSQISVDFDYATDVTVFAGNMNVVEVSNNSEFAWYQAYIQDSDGGSGSGFQIANDEDFTIEWFSTDTYS